MMKPFLKNILVGFPLLFLTLPIACSNQVQQGSAEKTNKEVNNTEQENLDDLQVAYFASGCFWCVEAVFQSVKGVEEAVSGYAGGSAATATYPQVSSGKTKHAESVMVYYDSTEISYETLLTVFFDSHDPSTLNQQGPDRGTQYRSEIFYSYPYQQESATAFIDSLLENKVYDRVTTLVEPFEAFYPAEDYHQEYERKHPNNPYVKSVSIPRLNKFKAKHPELLKTEEH
ncbi:MAG: peptide-methionine (S)-S-oxide reductase MsrA [Lishizhenia sp.]|nr:peptide-methionine (S)-S-oxide reductase MsrA [Lishizhenia sp.]